MSLKDYYSVLDLPAGAGSEAVKRAYRQMALQYHPDRNPGNPYAAAHFQESLEAYEVLSNPEKREAYHLERGYWKSTGKAFAEAGPITPQRLLLQARRLSEQVAVMDVYRMDQNALRLQLEEMLSGANLAQLEAYADSGVNEQIVYYLLAASAPLPYPFLGVILAALQRMGGKDALVQERISQFAQTKKREHLLNRYRIPALILLTIGICYLMYRLSQR